MGIAVADGYDNEIHEEENDDEDDANGGSSVGNGVFITVLYASDFALKAVMLVTHAILVKTFT